MNANGPGARPPQAILVALSPDGGEWTGDRLAALLDETMALARMRGVTLQQLPGAGRYLPALYFRDWSLQGEPVIDWLKVATEFNPDYAMQFLAVDEYDGLRLHHDREDSPRSPASRSREPPSWTRLEPQSYSGDPRPGIEARVHDPLWLLGRQWQLGEFEGEDAGTPLTVRVVTRTVAIDRWAPGDEGEARALDRERQDLLEPLVEREPVAADGLGPGLRPRAEAAAALLAALDDAGLGAHRAAFADNCPLDPRSGAPSRRRRRRARPRVATPRAAARRSRDGRRGADLPRLRGRRRGRPAPVAGGRRRGRGRRRFATCSGRGRAGTAPRSRPSPAARTPGSASDSSTASASAPASTVLAAPAHGRRRDRLAHVRRGPGRRARRAGRRRRRRPSRGRSTRCSPARCATPGCPPTASGRWRTRR